MMETKFPKGPYTFDDISRPTQDDGLGYIYLAEGGFNPTLAHTGDVALSPAENRALGNLFAAAPELYEALAMFVAMDGRNNLSAMKDIARAALAKARGEQP